MTGSVESKRGRGRKPKTSAREDTMLVRLTKRNNGKSSRKIVKDLKMNVSVLTVRLRFKNSGWIICIQRNRPYISKQNIPKRLAFAKQHILKDSQFQEYVSWSDGSKYELFGSRKSEKL
ncbi:hypothetical protein AVEN_111190-1 [Araneus ventricosus]|uniref:Transposase Tc1-like domain-containing protein n=1 Tax=Araneus ventricosus TaxID=182803 RepID=A0A4Y2T6T6_ARAVE|nr:hypothetical protein AVEN_111190-1 [Araneus ventricosus]